MTGIISFSCLSRTAAKFGVDVAKIFGNANLRFRLYGFKKVVRVTVFLKKPGKINGIFKNLTKIAGHSLKSAANHRLSDKTGFFSGSQKRLTIRIGSAFMYSLDRRRVRDPEAVNFRCTFVSSTKHRQKF